MLRELHRDAEARGDAVSMTRLDEAHDMAKRMQRRIEELRPKDPYIIANGGLYERKSQK